MKGTYTVLLSCKGRTIVRVGKLGRLRLQKGHYLYTGSALGAGAVSLEGRIERHKRRTKTLRWHIDYLTSNRSCKFAGAVYLECDQRLECRINRHICRTLQASPIFPRFGSSDCTCPSHLVRPERALTREELLSELESLYAGFNAVSSRDTTRCLELLPISS
jgi:Uri superfamily endonuclease